MVSKISPQEVTRKILEYYEQVLKKSEQGFTRNSEADKLIKSSPLAFLCAVIVDQGARAEAMWEIPYHLSKIWGHLDAFEIAAMTGEQLYEAFSQLPQRPRYWKTAARRIRKAAEQLVEKYEGNAGNIWNDNPRGGDLHSRFERFDGIGQKKASMATRILGMDLGVSIRNWEEIDVSVDEMIGRVFPRAGLCESSDPQAIINAARQLNPAFPGALDFPCWDIGRRWCRPQNPNCVQCYISEACPRIGV